MGYLVRTKDGELQFGSLGEVQQGVRSGLVGIEDEVQASDSTEWKAVGELEGCQPRPRFRINHWYVLAAALVLATALGGGIFAVLGILGMHGAWLGYVKKDGGRRPRFW